MLEEGAVVRVLREDDPAFFRVSYAGKAGFLLKDNAVDSTLQAFVQRLGRERADRGASRPEEAGEPYGDEKPNVAVDAAGPREPDRLAEVPRRFGALNTIGTLFRIIGWIVIVAGILLSIIGAAAIGGAGAGTEAAGAGAVTAVFILVGGIAGSLIYGVLLLAFADLVLLLIEVERNTRAAALSLVKSVP